MRTGVGPCGNCTRPSSRASRQSPGRLSISTPCPSCAGIDIQLAMSDIAQPVRIIDSHVHFWRIGGPGQTWPGAELPLLYRDFGLAEMLDPLPTATGDVQRVVLVQSHPDDRDTDWLLDLATDLTLVGAVAGWVDLASPSAPARIAELASKPKLRSIRPMLQAIEDTQWLPRQELEPALHSMVQHGLRFDALIQPRHLSMLMEFARR